MRNRHSSPRWHGLSCAPERCCARDWHIRVPHSPTVYFEIRAWFVSKAETHWCINCVLMRVMGASESLLLVYFRNVKRFGQQAWVCSTIIVTEVLICLKFDWELITRPLPTHIAWCWGAIVAVWLAWTAWHFFPRREAERSRISGRVKRD